MINWLYNPYKQRRGSDGTDYVTQTHTTLNPVSPPQPPRCLSSLRSSLKGLTLQGTPFVEPTTDRPNVSSSPEARRTSLPHQPQNRSIRVEERTWERFTLSYLPTLVYDTKRYSPTARTRVSVTHGPDPWVLFISPSSTFEDKDEGRPKPFCPINTSLKGRKRQEERLLVSNRLSGGPVKTT